MAWQYNPKTNRWEQSGGGAMPPTTTQPTNEFEYKKGQGYVPVTTTTMPPTTTAAPTTTTPKAGTTPSTTTTAPTKGKTTTKTKPKTLRERFPKNPDGTTQFPGAKQNQPLDPKTLSDVVSEMLGGGVSDSLLTAILGGGGGGGSTGPTTAQRVSAAKRANRQTTALANRFYGDQQTQANKAIQDATLEFLANIPKSTAYQQAPLVNLPPELYGLQEQLMSYGATGKDALAQQSQDAATASMYQALARQGATQLGAAEQGYLDALRRAGQGGQAAGLAGVAGNIADLKNQLALSNLQALIQAQTS